MSANKAWRTLPRAKERPIPEACSVFSYKDERIWRLVWALKYKKSKPAAKIGGFALNKVLQSYAKVVDHLIVVPMPITRRRRRERGYNQCELLAGELAALDADRRLTIARNLLTRTKHRSRQTLKDREHRLESTENLFAVNKEIADKYLKALNGRYLLIVIDDVVTTGSTIKSAIMTLRQAGFEHTYGMSVAH